MTASIDPAYRKSSDGAIGASIPRDPMTLLDLARSNLISPPVLCFALGAAAVSPIARTLSFTTWASPFFSTSCEVKLS